MKLKYIRRFLWRCQFKTLNCVQKCLVVSFIGLQVTVIGHRYRKLQNSFFNHVELERIHPAGDFTCSCEKHFSFQDHTIISTLPTNILYQYSSDGNEYDSVNTACYYIVLVLKCIISVRILWRSRKKQFFKHFEMFLNLGLGPWVITLHFHLEQIRVHTVTSRSEMWTFFLRNIFQELQVHVKAHNPSTYQTTVNISKCIQGITFIK
jgi:hypothetical protein